MHSQDLLAVGSNPYLGLSHTTALAGKVHSLQQPGLSWHHLQHHLQGKNNIIKVLLQKAGSSLKPQKQDSRKKDDSKNIQSLKIIILVRGNPLDLVLCNFCCDINILQLRVRTKSLLLLVSKEWIGKEIPNLKTCQNFVHKIWRIPERSSVYLMDPS